MPQPEASPRNPCFTCEDSLLLQHTRVCTSTNHGFLASAIWCFWSDTQQRHFPQHARLHNQTQLTPTTNWYSDHRFLISAMYISVWQSQAKTHKSIANDAVTSVPCFCNTCMAVCLCNQNTTTKTTNHDHKCEKWRAPSQQHHLPQHTSACACMNMCVRVYIYINAYTLNKTHITKCFKIEPYHKTRPMTYVIWSALLSSGLAWYDTS